MTHAPLGTADNSFSFVVCDTCPSTNFSSCAPAADTPSNDAIDRADAGTRRRATPSQRPQYSLRLHKSHLYQFCPQYLDSAFPRGKRNKTSFAIIRRIWPNLCDLEKRAFRVRSIHWLDLSSIETDYLYLLPCQEILRTSASLSPLFRPR